MNINIFKTFTGLLIVLISIVFAGFQEKDKIYTNIQKAYAETDEAAEPQDSIYNLELKRWNIYNDGTHPIETTKGFNDALKWAHANGKTTFKVPAGTYLIAKGTTNGYADPNARINMVPNMTFWLDDEAVIQKETNGYEIYHTVYLGFGADNVVLKGGTYKGDRETHDYSLKGPYTSGTHEWGSGILIVGAKNVTVEDTNIKEFTGDGIYIGGSTITGSYLTEEYLEQGSLDQNGKPVSAPGKIRTVGRTQTNFDKPEYKIHRNIHMWLPKGLSSQKYDVCYYRKDNSFIKCEQNLEVYRKGSEIPEGADYFRAVFDAPKTSGVEVNRMTITNSQNILLKNNDIGYNRRQGITAGGEDIQIVGNKIHHTNGVAPQSGIDIEPDFYPGRNQLIKGNEFYNNKIQIVLAYGGGGTVIEENYFKQENLPGASGVTVHKTYRGTVVNNNTFDGSSLNFQNENTSGTGNKFIDSSVTLGGEYNKFSNAVLKDSSLSVGEKLGAEVSNISIINTGAKRDKKGILYVWGQPAVIKNIKIQGSPLEGAVISGYGSSKTIFENLSLENTSESTLPAGTYNNCAFVSSSAQTGRIKMDYPGTILNSCTLKNRTLMTYNTNANAVIKNSSFTFTGDLKEPAIYALQANKIDVVNNKINAQKLTNTYNPMIKIGRFAWKNRNTEVLSGTITSNVISTNLAVGGIDTTDGGIGAPPYTVNNNTLYKAKLFLTTKDKAYNNILK